ASNRLAGGMGNDHFEGRAGDDRLLSQGGDDVLVGGDGSDTLTLTGITAGQDRRVTIRNGGSDGRTDLIFLDEDHGILSHSQITDEYLEVVADGVILQLYGWEEGIGGENPAFRIATRDGFTYEINADGSLSVYSVDVSQAESRLIDGSVTEDPARAASIVTQYGAGVFVSPQTPNGARILKGDVRGNTLVGGPGGNLLLSGGNWDASDLLKGGDGEDTYVLETTGTYTIDNTASDGAEDMVILAADFNDLQASREGNHLRLITALHFVLELRDYFTDESVRHIRFVSQDGVTFEISGVALGVEDHTVVRKTITGFNFSGNENAVTIDLSDHTAYPSAVLAVDTFVGTRTAANTVVTGDRATQVVTGNANDRVTGSFQSDVIQTLAGNDEIESSAGDDRIWAGDGHDRIIAGDGNDLLVGGFGEDVLDGGSGSDTLVYLGDIQTQTGVSVSLSLGRGVGADAQGDEIKNVENLYGTDFGDTLEGDDTSNTLSGGLGDDLLYGRAGDDLLLPGRGNDHIDGGSGSDWLLYADALTGVNIDLTRGSVLISDTETHTIQGIENLQGSAFDDVVRGDENANQVLGTLGRDRIDLGAGEDLVDYSALELDTPQGFWIDLTSPVLDNDTNPIEQGYRVQWLTHVEELRGSSAADRFIGTDGAETLDGFSGVDEIRARGGDDFLIGRAEGDLLHGGEGNDTVDYALASQGIRASLTTGFGNALDRFVSIENLSGSIFDDVLEGDANANTLFGNQGLDKMWGLGGDDTFKGMGDGDLFIGGEGEDTADFGEAGLGVVVTMGLAPFIGAEREKWESNPLRTDHLVGVETVYGSFFDDLIQGSLASGETLYGQGGNDWLLGSSQGQTLDRDPSGVLAQAAPVPLRDTLDGGDGIDIVSYAHARAGIYANLATGMAGGDRFRFIEGVEGSEHSDVMRGDDGANLFFASYGQDQIDGGAGIDTLDFRLTGAQDGVSVVSTDDSGTAYRGELTNGGERSETLAQDIEIVHGTAFDDRFTGGDGEEHFRGDAGSDQFTGGQGDDRLEGGDGDDLYLYAAGDGSDTIMDTSGADRILISGASVLDVALWSNGNDLLIGVGQETLTLEEGLVEESRVEHIELEGGLVMTANAAAQLVDAMAAFVSASGLEIESAQDVAAHRQLMTLVSSSWQPGGQ
ncbi:MAG: hypothetical protein MI742_15015, partial [Desulfobacterales bacterium]|nr:hypothetical protein [Desulfobacterales bacterium]